MRVASDGPAFSCDVSFAYFVLADCYLLMIVNTAGRTMADYISGVDCDPCGIVMTPDGRFVYMLNRESVDVSVVDLATKTVIAKIPLCSPKD